MKKTFEPLTVQIRDENTLRALAEWTARQPIPVSLHKAACFHINQNIRSDNKRSME